MRTAHGPWIWRHRSELPTPALVLDLAAARRNIDKMAQRVTELGCAIRPHAKVHKSPRMAPLQVDAGAVGLCVATTWEAMVFVAAGFGHVYLINTVADPRRIDVLAGLRDADVAVAVDDPDNAEAISRAAVRAGSTVGLLIEVDTGMDPAASTRSRRRRRSPGGSRACRAYGCWAWPGTRATAR